MTANNSERPNGAAAPSTAGLESVTLQSSSGMRVKVLNIGAALQSIHLPVGSGEINAILGYPDPAGYLTDTSYQGVTVGRFANRIENARLSLGDRVWELEANETATGHCLHGGYSGWHRRLWSLSPDEDERSVTCTYRSPDGEGGFPGAVDASVKYTVDNNELIIDYVATSDRLTVVSMANHAYFNLDGDSETIDEHELTVFADRYTPVDDSKIPSGEISPVAGTRFDLQQGTRLGTPSGPLVIDHNFVLPDPKPELYRAASLVSPRSGVGLSVLTSQPGLQVYTGDLLGAPFRPRQGMCLETQSYPDAPNQSGFPSAELSPGSTYRHRTVLEFHL